MRRFLTLVCLLCLALPAGISISGCYRNPAANYCNGLGYGLKDTDVYSITLQPATTGLSLAFGQTRQANAPAAYNCKGASAAASAFTYGTSNNLLVDISPSGNICAGTWNRNSGGGIPNYTICTAPDPLPVSKEGLPYASAYLTASAAGVTSNPVQVFVHAQVTSITLVGPQQCLSQTQQAQLDAQACYSATVANKPTNVLFCAPSSVTAQNYACPLAPGVASVPSCSNSLGTLGYNVNTTSVASINAQTNEITALQPGTTAVTAFLTGTGSTAGYFSTCPPKSISVTLANGTTSGTITQGVTQNLVTTVTDTNGQTITGLTLDYQSTDPIDIAAGSGGAVTTSFPGQASVYAICQPSVCNPAPINVVGLNGTGLSVSSNAVNIRTPGTASDYVWFAAPGQSQYFVPIELLEGTVGSTVRLPYVPNSMIMDRTGSSLYFGSSRELMIFSTFSNTLTKQDPSVPGVVLAVAPNNTSLLINSQTNVSPTFYIYNSGGSIGSTFPGLGAAAAWTPDSKTLYITDSAALGGAHTDTLYVYNGNTGWTTYPLAASDPKSPEANPGAQSLAITIPGVGAFLSGNPTVAHTWCPTGTIGNYASMSFYPQPPNDEDSVPTLTDILAATTDGQHILGASFTKGTGIMLSDIGVNVPNGECPAAVNGVLQPLTIPFTLNAALNVSKVSASAVSAVNQVIPSPASNLAFITYSPSPSPEFNAPLPYYVPGTSGAAGTLNYVTLTGSAAITAPVAGAFSPDDKLFFVSTAGDNQIHYISVPTLTDTQQISPNLPACTPSSASDPNCLNTTLPAGSFVPATVIAVKPRSTT
jgi:hypothetical protein